MAFIPNRRWLCIPWLLFCTRLCHGAARSCYAIGLPLRDLGRVPGDGTCADVERWGESAGLDAFVDRAAFYAYQRTQILHAENTDVRFHAEVSVVAFLRLMHLRVAFAIFVFRRRRCGNQCGIDDSPFAHHQALFSKMPGNRIEDLTGQILRFKQVAKLQKRCRIRRRFVA